MKVIEQHEEILGNVKSMGAIVEKDSGEQVYVEWHGMIDEETPDPFDLVEEIELAESTPEGNA
jgi:hypothetical protein